MHSSYDSEAENYAPPATKTKRAAPYTARAAGVSRKKAVPLEDFTSDPVSFDAPSEDDDFSLAAESPVKKPKTSAPKKTSKPFERRENEMDFDANTEQAPSARMAKSKSSTETYQKLTQLEHILKRPDTYVGTTDATTRQMWVYDGESNQMQYRSVTFVPGLYKIFDEILVNAADNKQRDSNMDTLKVTIDREKNTISVYNNGRGIPIELHDKEKIYIPELIFGHLLTSSNYDDEEKKVTGGRNGYGAKLCNIFSTEFILETADKERGHKYKQVWTDNMGKMRPAKITANPKNEEYTRITFSPDLSKFGIERMDDDFEAILKRRVYDLAGCTKDVKVFLNGERIKVRNFKHYVEMYANAVAKESGQIGTPSKPAIIYERVNDRWEIAFSLSDGGFNQVSFVNSIATTSGGTHVNLIADQLIQKLGEQVKKKNKAAPVKSSQIRNHFFLFVNCLIENPAFTSQTKEQLATKASKFGSKCLLPDAFTKKVMNSGVMDSILDFARVKADQAMKRADGGSKRSRITGLVKLEDASKAGTRDGHKCTLILTEGDSAKSLAVAGMSVVGREHFGVFPLRGKLLNVRDATHEAVMNNAEIAAIKKILGLQHKKSYSETKELRYGHLMIMTDQDHDGSHIKGLIINFLEAHFPSLLNIPGFLIEFITPIVKCWRKTNKKDEVSFFTLPEYELWREQVTNIPAWEIKYFKGLGTSSAADAKQYFGDLDRHLKRFHAIQEGDPELIDMAFSKKKADDRKEWLRLFKPGTYIDHSVDNIRISDFINKELILFSMADNVRSIPSIVDGFKPGQRKVLFACFKRKLKSEIKVAQLQGYVAEQTAYHHGEQSLAMTIVGMAQNFVGSNNLNLLEPNGQFGTRDKGGKDAASARYIFTDLSPLARKVFPAADDALLTYLDDDGKSVEPEWFVPILPMVLVNGADGIGTGWSTTIPCYHPLEIVDNLRKLMLGEEMSQMHPWFRGFDGDISVHAPGKYKVTGKISQIDDDKLEITELPVRKWILDMKEFLDFASSGNEKAPAWVTNFEEFHETNKVHFIVSTTPKDMQSAVAEGLENRFKLVSSMGTGNMVAFDSAGRIKRYSTPEEVISEFYHIRLDYYQRRKTYLANELTLQLDRLANQARFVQMIIDRELVVSNRRRDELVKELKLKGFKPFPKSRDMKAAIDEEEEGIDRELASSDYDYLLGMAIWSLTREKVEKLLDSKSAKEDELSELLKLSPKGMWSRDLDAFVVEWHATETRRLNDASHSVSKKKASKLLGKKPGKSNAKKRKSLDSDGEQIDDEWSPKKMKKAPIAKAASKQSTLDFTSKVKNDLDDDLVKPAEVPAQKEEDAKKAKKEDPKPTATVKPNVKNDTLDDLDWAKLAKGLGEREQQKPMFHSNQGSAKQFTILSSEDDTFSPPPVEVTEKAAAATITSEAAMARSKAVPKPKKIEDSSDLESLPAVSAKRTARTARARPTPAYHDLVSAEEDEEDVYTEPVSDVEEDYSD